MRNQNNVIEFPGVKNIKLNNLQKELVKNFASIDLKMKDKNWSINLLNEEELNVLTFYGETLEFAPQVAARLIAVLSTSIKTNSLMEDF